MSLEYFDRVMAMLQESLAKPRPIAVTCPSCHGKVYEVFTCPNCTGECCSLCRPFHAAAECNKVRRADEKETRG